MEQALKDSVRTLKAYIQNQNSHQTLVLAGVGMDGRTQRPDVCPLCQRCQCSRRPRTRRAARIAAFGRTAPLARWRALDCRCEWQDVGAWQVRWCATRSTCPMYMGQVAAASVSS